jgi:hypothetical protein
MSTLSSSSKKIIVGKYYMLKYFDAAYSYVDILDDGIQMPGQIVSVGYVRRSTDSLVDLSLTWGADEGSVFYDGIVIPKKAISCARQIELYD